MASATAFLKMPNNNFALTSRHSVAPSSSTTITLNNPSPPHISPAYISSDTFPSGTLSLQKHTLPSTLGKQRHRAHVAVRAESDGSSSSSSRSSGGVEVVRKAAVPRTVEQSVSQASAAVGKAVAEGVTRQQLELLLPLIGPSLLDDWPGGIQQQLKAATPLVTKILNGLGTSSWEKTVLSDEDAVVQWANSQAALVLFPNAETLPTLRQLASSSRPLLIVNPQWQPGQVVSDFGFGGRSKEAEEFLSLFQVTYSLKQTRIRGSGVTIVRSFPSEWCVYRADDGTGEFCFAGSQPSRPSYKETESLVVAAEAASSTGKLGLFDRLAREMKFLKDNK